MIQEAIERLVEGFDLSEIESYAVMKEIMRGDATEAQVAAYLSLLCHKGETVDEISGSVRCVRECAVPVRLKASDAIDLCGTGGDGRLSFNISTTAAFVVA
ncbi:MAG: anthranilate phosphoribosyltransferase, partial [Planctomycetota bacterium]|nr:anthranilate phosphoribosyltransferase [Planctomycetota bacterium]